MLGLAVASSFVAKAADSPESDQAFSAASQAFRDEFWDKADRELAAFVAQYPASRHAPAAILLQAQSRFQLKRFGATVDLLTDKLSAAGAQADQYHYWIAEAQFQRGNFEGAAESYAELLRQSPNSPLRLKAAYGEAFARFQLGDLARTIDLLQKPGGTFQQTAKDFPAEESAIRGSLLLGEAHYKQRNYPGATEVLNRLASPVPPPELDWQRQYLLGMVELAAQNADAALARTTNLLVIATTAGKPLLQAASLKFQAEILERKQPAAAIQAYDRIAQIKNLPVEQVRQAILKSVDLAVAQNLLTNAIDRLRVYVALTNSAADPALDLLRLTLGELHLKRYYQLAGGATNQGRARQVDTDSLQQARTQFDFLIKTHTNSALLGKAYLNRGWCLWEEARTPGTEARLPECTTSFRLATEHLTNSEDQAVARFKWADCQFLQRDFTNAIQNYRALLTSYESAPSIKAKWFDQTLYQIVRASIELSDFTSARAAFDRILAEFPTSPIADHAMVFFAQAFLETGEPLRAREIFVDFRKRFPGSPLKAEAELGMARSYAQEANWPAAIEQYRNWTSIYTNHAARPQTEFDLALATYKSGNETNALALFLNVATQYPASKLAPLAQLWVGDYYFSRGPFESGAYQRAEENYRILLQNTNALSRDLSYQARLMAARAAFAWQGYNNARNHLTNLITRLSADTNAPSSLLAEALFLWGTIDLNEPAAPNVNSFAKFDTAISKFLRVKGGAIEPRARCKIGYCYVQLASTNAQYYDQAAHEFERVIDSPAADSATRSEARYLLGGVLEKQAADAARTGEERRKLLHRALDHYLDVIYGKRPPQQQKEPPDLYWINRAGLSAGTLAEQLQLLGPARRIYERLRDTLPALPAMRELLDQKIESLPPEAKG